MSDPQPPLASREPPAPRHAPALAALEPAPGPCTAFALLHELREGRTKEGKPYFDLTLTDRTATVRGKVWADSAKAMEAIRALTRGAIVKVLGEVERYQGAVQLNVKNARLVGPEDGCDERALLPEGLELVRDLLCATLAFDIETVPGHDRRALPPTIAQAVTRHAERWDGDETKVMSLSPWLGRVVSLAVGDAEQPPAEQRVTVLVVPPEETPLGPLPDWIRPVSEPDLLRAFWALASAAQTVVSFNGRGFDVPFLLGRSLAHRVAARVDLLRHQGPRPHLDLLKVLQGERSQGPVNLDLACWALGIESPKGEMDGSMVAAAYAAGELQKIAAYNALDVRATTAIYRRVRDLVLRFREDW